jgi:hypothetical protein
MKQSFCDTQAKPCHTKERADKIISVSKVKLYKYFCPWCQSYHLTHIKQK